MGKIIVYRVQDAHGRGPWKSGFSHRWVEGRHDHGNLAPWYVEFGPVHRHALHGEHVGCGCKTLEQLRRWFTESEYLMLLKYGYKAVQMNVGRLLAESEIQCVFGRSKALNKGVIEVNLYRKE